MGEEAVGDQSGAGGDGGESEVTDPLGISESSGLQTGGGSEKASGETIGPKELPPELEAQRKELLRDYHRKTQAIAEERRRVEGELTRYKQDAETLYDLTQKPWFKAAVDAERQRRQGRAVGDDISDEQFEVIKNDRRAFTEFLAKREKAIAESVRAELDGKMGALSQRQEALLAEREFETVAGKYGDGFRSANDEGKLDPYLEAGLDYATAYAKYLLDSGEKPEVVRREAESLLRKKSNGSVEKTGLASAKGGPTIKAKSFDDMFRKVADMTRRGVKDYTVERGS